MCIRDRDRTEGDVMQSKNKKPMTRFERAHVEQVKALPCAVCGTEKEGREAHEMKQGLYFIVIPLCPDCHRCV